MYIYIYTYTYAYPLLVAPEEAPNLPTKIIPTKMP